VRAAGCTVGVFPAEAFDPEELLRRVRAFAPDCLHAFHARQGGGPARALAASLGIPYLITLTGTDIYGAWDEADRDEARAILSAAVALIVFHDRIGQRLLQQYPGLAVPVAVIPQGVSVAQPLPTQPPPDRVVFFLPAGIRPVKDVLFPLEPLAALYPRFPGLRFALAGPVLDPDYGARVLATLQGYPFASWLGEVPHEAMALQYAAAGVVLNTSLSEGGMANSLLEAMAAARPVLAADVEGNRSLVTDGVNGLLYGGAAEFGAKAAQLLADPGLRRRLGLAGRRYVEQECSPEREAARYLDLYGAVTNRAALPLHFG
jgi:glycosyltransferase involved in cell wall biosynthesis